MPATSRTYKVFVASPSDVAEERARLDEVIAEINITRSDGDTRLELIKWETHALPA